MHELLIKPIDSLLFRDGKPFQGGESHKAISIFPPSPSVFAGFIRSKILTENCDDGDIESAWEKAKKIIGEKGKEPNFEIKAILYKFNNHYYLPTPFDIVKESDKSEKNNKKYFILSPDNAPQNNEFYYKTNSDLKLPFPPKNAPILDSAERYISITKLKEYLEGKYEFTEKDFQEDSNFYKVEDRVGIAVDNQTNTAKEHNLYSASFLRFSDNFEFSVIVDNLDYEFKDKPYFIGGEKRQVRLEIKNDFKFENKINTTKLKIILITPAYTNSKEPTTEKIKNLLENKFKGKVVSACLRTEQRGGFDILKGEPKPLETLISAGSVFYIKLEKETDLSELNFQSISDKDEKLGFGRIIAGKW